VNRGGDDYGQHEIKRPGATSMKGHDNEKREAAAAWRKAVCLGHGCVVCGAHSEGHHLIAKRFRRFRYIKENGCPLCTRHHAWAHSNPAEFKTWLRAHRRKRWEWWDANWPRALQGLEPIAIKE